MSELSKREMAIFVETDYTGTNEESGTSLFLVMDVLRVHDLIRG